ncbi:hypothetical protein [Paenibacillus sabinae]|uniref:YCII-related domain-containing protein n=1 Tax=Paenibacillus sabinae T27 TaxID=1268072 RepID=X4ZJB0_9BACL|nr:hypothetical protein [Paenibacillus sabinae]AHV99541.1 hypothetical protein PSAB_23270 [Paenibacillus sabinae T27]
MNRYLIITERTERFNPDDIQGHYEHLDQLKKENRLEMYGPFSDSSGGAYLTAFREKSHSSTGRG